MNSNEVLAVLNQIAATSSRNAKQALVAEHIEDSQFQWALTMAYNPYNIFGILPVGDEVGGGQCEFVEAGVTELLDRLVSRTLTGQAARDALNATYAVLSVESGDLLTRILRKDLRAGFSESTCNKAKKGLIPEFAYMRCSLPKDTKLKEWPWAMGVLSQEKADGTFANGNLNTDGAFTFLSRQGTIYPMSEMEELATEMRRFMPQGFQYHGEILVEENGVILDRELGNGVMSSIASGGKFEPGQRPVYVIWDMVPLEAVQTGKHSLPYARRFTAIVTALKNSGAKSIKPIPTRICKTLRQALEHCKELVAQGKEGTVIKKPTMEWKDGTSKDQIKLKLTAECDLQVVGVLLGKKGTKNEHRAGSLSCVTSDGLLKVDVTVKNEKMRDDVDANQDNWVGSIIPVLFNDVMKPSESSDCHSLFLPRMAEAAYRTDKSEPDSLERVYAQLDGAIDKMIAELLGEDA